MKYENKKKAIEAVGTLFGFGMMMSEEKALKLHRDNTDAVIADNDLDREDIYKAQEIGARVFRELVANAKRAQESEEKPTPWYKEKISDKFHSGGAE